MELNETLKILYPEYYGNTYQYLTKIKPRGFPSLVNMIWK